MEKFKTINRSAVIIDPKKPFWDCVNSIEPGLESDLMPDLMKEGTIYLLPEFDDPSGTDDCLRKIYNDIFENELMAWFTDESLWPKDRSWDKFREWFDYRIHEIVWDTVDETMAKE